MRRLTAVNTPAPPLPSPSLSYHRSSIYHPTSFIRFLSSFVTPKPLSHPAAPSPDLSGQLFSLLCQCNWEKDPSFRNLIPSITPSLFSSLLTQYPHLNPRVTFNLFNFLSQKPAFNPNVQVQASLFRILIKNRSFGYAKKIWDFMVKTAKTAEDARLVLSILREVNRGDDGEVSFRLSVKCFNNLLMLLARFQMIDDVECVYKEMLDMKISPNVYTYNTLINAHCKLGNVSKAEHYFGMIFEAGLEPQTHTFTSFILGYCKIQDVDSAYKVFKTMPEKDCSWNEYSYTKLMDGLCKAGRVDEAKELFFQMRVDDRCSPGVKTYTILISALCLFGRWSEALILLNEMKEKDCPPNVHTYTELIVGACKGGKIKAAEQILQLMLVNGLLPNVVAYNALQHGYLKKGKVDMALKVFNKMKADDCNPNVETYNNLISGFCKLKEVHKVKEILRKMVEEKVKPTVVTFNILVRERCKVNVDSALCLISDMKKINLVPDHYTYGHVIQALCEKGSVGEAYDIFNYLEEKSMPMDVVLYTNLIDGFCKEEKVEFAEDLLKRMITKGYVPNSHTYNVMIKGLCEVNKLPEAWKYLGRMLRAGMDEIGTYSIIIDGILKEYDFDKAYRVNSLLITLGHQPNICTYTPFLSAYCNQGKLKEAEDLMKKVKEQGVQPDLKAYTALADGYARSRFLDQAFDTFRCMVDAGIEPSQYTYAVLIKNLLIEKFVSENGSDDSINIIDVWKKMEHGTALNLFEKMKEHGCPPNANTYTEIIRGLHTEGRLEEVRKLFDHAKQCGISLNEKIYCSYNYDEVGWKVLIDGLLMEAGRPNEKSVCLLNPHKEEV